MAIDVQLAIIKKGPQYWNDWRTANPDTVIDLNDANLSNLDLSGADLREAWLNQVDFSGANLSGANLSNARLDGANLQKTNLTRADLRKAHLREAFLLQSILNKADLSEAVLTYADLRKADLSEANFNNANLADANLGAAQMNNAQFTDACMMRANLVQCDGELVNFTGAILENAQVAGAVLNRSDFSDAKLSTAYFSGSHLYHAIFRNADLFQSDFSNTGLGHADFTRAYLVEVNLNLANMQDANLTEANLQKAILVQTNLEGAILTNACIYGVSAWDLKGVPKEQSNLVITQDPTYLLYKTGSSKKAGAITVDNLQVAQFIYLLLNRQTLRNVIDTITSKAVLILGRFTPERKKILDAMADELRKNNLLPIIFDFEKPTDRDFTETIKTLAGISLFIIADITSPKSSPLELQAIVPDYQIPLVPIIQAGEQPFSMLGDLIGKHDWVLSPVLTYTSADQLVAGFKMGVIDRAWNKHKELQKKKFSIIDMLSIESFTQKPES